MLTYPNLMSHFFLSWASRETSYLNVWGWPKGQDEFDHETPRNPLLILISIIKRIAS